MKTPHISIRVSKNELSAWQEACRIKETNVSEMARKLMNAFANSCQTEIEMREMLHDFKEGEYASM